MTSEQMAQTLEQMADSRRRMPSHSDAPYVESLTAGAAALRREARGVVQHGVSCPKVAHRGAGYLHAEDDDRGYDVDGITYCGRCHQSVAVASDPA